MEPVDLNAPDEKLAEALWNLQHQKSELWEQETRVTRELARRATTSRIKAGEFTIVVQHRAHVTRAVPDKFLGSEAAGE